MRVGLHVGMCVCVRVRACVRVFAAPKRARASSFFRQARESTARNNSATKKIISGFIGNLRGGDNINKKQNGS